MDDAPAEHLDRPPSNAGDTGGPFLDGGMLSDVRPGSDVQPGSAANGSPCTGAAQCSSGYCSDGVCCDSACVGQCEACAEGGKLGQCVAVMGAPRSGHSPCDGSKDVCRGSCNGSARAQCTYPGSEVSCAPASCANGSVTTASLCNGAGGCTATMMMACQSHQCADGTKCLGACGPGAPCPNGTYCDSSGACLTLRTNGSACQTGAECSSNVCADGVCCNMACSGACRACNLGGALGQCSPVRSGDDNGCNGTCDASGSCKKRLGDDCTPGTASSCVNGFCVDGKCCAQSSCGTCQVCGGPSGSCAAVKNADDDTCNGQSKCDSAGRCATRFAEYTAAPAASQLIGIAAGPDGNIWFTDHDNNKVGRISTSGNHITPDITTAMGPSPITAGKDGNLWFTEVRTNMVGRVSTGGSLKEFTTMTAFGGAPGQIVVGPDNNLWFTIGGGNKVARATTAGVITEFTVSTPAASPLGITAGPDGALWFTEYTTNKIGRITTGGTITGEFTVPTADSGPEAVVAGPDGNLWFTEFKANKIGRMTTSGTTTEFPVPTASSGPSELTVGPDGNIWFTEYSGAIARITPSGSITEFPTPTANSGPLEITVGPDGNLWFTESAVGKIGRFIP